MAEHVAGQLKSFGQFTYAVAKESLIEFFQPIALSIAGIRRLVSLARFPIFPEVVVRTLRRHSAEMAEIRRDLEELRQSRPIREAAVGAVRPPQEDPRQEFVRLLYEDARLKSAQAHLDLHPNIFEFSAPRSPGAKIEFPLTILEYPGAASGLQAQGVLEKLKLAATFNLQSRFEDAQLMAEQVLSIAIQQGMASLVLRAYAQQVEAYVGLGQLDRAFEALRRAVEVQVRAKQFSSEKSDF